MDGSNGRADPIVFVAGTVQRICQEIEPLLVPAFLEQKSPFDTDGSISSSKTAASTADVKDVTDILKRNWKELLRGDRDINSPANAITDVAVRIMRHVREVEGGWGEGEGG
eukprot:TRINITY_DN1410_c3_g1_i1.p2 TRINITY_DN1410_c3_g1~~TRINITY_DN1410_c3_g1_i1.p2  ORF type:complete len:111 (-),score=33.40 TRINITY_DN1410_c3_g1_i1:404-736(-)